MKRLRVYVAGGGKCYILTALLTTATWMSVSAQQTPTPLPQNTLPPMGNVGINTTSPSVPLEVVGQSKIIGRLKVDSMVIVRDSVRVHRDLSVLGSTKVKGRLTISGPARFKEKAVISGLTRMKSNAVIHGNLRIKSLADTSANHRGMLLITPNGKVTKGPDIDPGIIDDACVAPKILPWVSARNFASYAGAKKDVVLCPYSYRNVGIGTVHPLARLDIWGGKADTYGWNKTLRLSDTSSTIFSGSSTQTLLFNMKSTGTPAFTFAYQMGSSVQVPLLHIRSIGLVGINTTNPDRPLSVQGHGGHTELISLKNSGGQTEWHINFRSGGLNFAETGVADARLFLQKGGNVGIGTDQPAYKLDVCGTIRSKEWIVETGWCDYVFEEGYTRPTWQEIKSHYLTFKNLPQMPKGKKVETEGLHMSEAWRGAAYNIELNRLDITALYEKIAQLEEEVEKLKLENENLKPHPVNRSMHK